MSLAAKVKPLPVVAGVAFERKEGSPGVQKVPCVRRKSIPYLAATASKPFKTRLKHKMQAKTPRSPLKAPGKAVRLSTNSYTKAQSEEQPLWDNPLDTYGPLIWVVDLLVVIWLWSILVSK
ncbi:hypothetical protein KFL_000720030 [Klebsormidium nitens]|uniref:Uncharacterized protein n=1 Tax=Klebsormidium nitens TaxID=105231 RepID=A0A1Y1HR66_KLENI|nr:hypothetical protein KFL_000720030 [Klebsormidium nitens]|eukprot:GAQ81134.1 hypothetical protein KFL_000720030 [Klebsormidium nitens]